jgi:hypothetical protein
MRLAKQNHVAMTMTTAMHNAPATKLKTPLREIVWVRVIVTKR